MIFETCGRRILVEFTCGRCGKKHTEPYELQHSDTEGNLHLYKPPEGWLGNSINNPMLCKECNEQYQAFLIGCIVVT